MDDQSKAPVQPVRKSTAPPSANPSPTHSRAPTSTTSAEPPKPASTPIHPASSISEVGGTSSSLPSLQTPSSSTPATPISAPSSAPQTPITRGSSGSSAPTPKENGSQGASSHEAGSQEAETLKKENAKLKEELTERDHLIRKLELQVESLQANAKIAREALSKF